MVFDSLQSKGRDRTISTLNVTIEVLNLAKEVSSIAPAKAIFGTVSILLTLIRVRGLQSRDGVLPAHINPGHHV
jgi:hypothetical protein